LDSSNISWISWSISEKRDCRESQRIEFQGAASVIVGQKSLDCEQFLNDVGEAVCSEMGLLFSHCVDYHLDISDVSGATFAMSSVSSWPSNCQ
jgi:hypothetical protein